MVINEVLASAISYVAPGATTTADAVEIFNGGNSVVNLTGWKLRRIAGAGEEQKGDFTFPILTLQPGGRTVVYCTELPGQAPFKLPASGATLRLFDAAGSEVSTVTYGPQQPDVSYSRLADASRTFVYNPLPSIGTENYDNGNTDPVITFNGMDLTLLRSNTWRFRAQAWSASGMFTLIIYWREVTDSPNPRSGSIPLFDDGMHDDGASLDGEFAGDWDVPLPRGTAIEFYITGTDLRGESATEPNGQEFRVQGQPITNFTLTIPAVASGLEISEVLAINQGGLRDENGDSPDWAEVRYTGPGTIPVEGLFLSDSLFGFDLDELYDISGQGGVISTGTSHVIFLDGTDPGGIDPRHAPFKLDGDGDTIYLLRRLPSGVTELVDWVKVPTLAANVAYARMGAGGEFVQTDPTPDAPNAPVAGRLYLFPTALGLADAIFAFRGAGSIEASADLITWTTVLSATPDDGIEHAYREPIANKRFFRVKR